MALKREMNISEFTKEYLIEKMNDYKAVCSQFNVEVNIYSCNQGCGRDAKHLYYYVQIGHDEIRDGGKFRTAYAFAEYINKVFKSFEVDLRKQNIFFVWEEDWFENGIDYVWRSPKNDKLDSVSKIVKITPSKSFYDLQSWLKKKANFELNIFDLYTCSICQKRSSKHYSNYNYTCKNDSKMSRYLNELKKNYKQGYKVVVNKFEEDYFDGYDGNRYEYEQYGSRDSWVEVAISTPTGRNEKKVSLRW